MVENRPKSRIQHGERSELRIQFFIKNAKNGQIWKSFWKPEACGPTVLPDRSLLIGQKLVKISKMPKIQMRHFEQFFNIVQFSQFIFWKVFCHGAYVSAPLHSIDSSQQKRKRDLLFLLRRRCSILFLPIFLFSHIWHFSWLGCLFEPICLTSFTLALLYLDAARAFPEGTLFLHSVPITEN